MAGPGMVYRLCRHSLGIVRFQGDFTQFFLAAPTLLCCLIGGALAGITIWMMRSCGNRLSKEEDAV